MAHFYGTLQGARGEATRLGSKNSGMHTKACSYQGAVRVETDTDAQNPFKDGDCNWPISVRAGRRESITDYEEHIPGPCIRNPLAFFTDELVIHMQIHIATAFGSDVRTLLADVGIDEPPAYSHDADALRQAFVEAFDNEDESKQLAMCVELFTVAGIPAIVTEVRGHCQGDWAEVMVVAPPQAVAKFGCANVTTADLESTAELYGSWAFGDCFGYIIEAPAAVDEDGDVTEWEEIEHGSCWGYYGTDHDKSGLAESALDSIPDEAPVMPEYDGELEDA